MARLPNFLVIIRSEKLSGKGQGRGCLGVRKKERFVLGKRTFRSQKSKHFVLRIIDFNEAIAMGQKNSIEVAWSNEAFELWYLYHFQNVITGVSRKDYEEKISTAVNASPKYKSKKKYRYAKKDPNNYKIMTTYGSMESALRYAEAKHLEYADSRYANQNPCTTIYQLVRQLLGRDEKLNAELIARIGENEL